MDMYAYMQNIYILLVCTFFPVLSLDIFSIKQNWNGTETFPFVLLQESGNLELNTSQHNYYDDMRIQKVLRFFFLLWSFKLLLFILASFSYSKLPGTKWKSEKYQKKTYEKCHATSTGTKKKLYDPTCFCSGFASFLKIYVYICISKPVS